MVALAWVDEDELVGFVPDDEELASVEGPGASELVVGVGRPVEGRGRRGPLRHAAARTAFPGGGAFVAGARRRVARKFFWRRVLVAWAVAVVAALTWGAAEQIFGSGAAPAAGWATCSQPAALDQVVDLASSGPGGPSGAGLPGRAVHHLDLAGNADSTCPLLYVVRPGDTIWGIAVRLSGDADPRPLVAQLEAEIGGGTLQPGQVLVVPPGPAGR